MLVNYSTVQPGTRYRILNQVEIWTKRGIKIESFLKKDVKVFVEPKPFIIDGQAEVFGYMDSIDFFGYEFEKYTDGLELTKIEGELFVSPTIILSYLKDVYYDV